MKQTLLSKSLSQREEKKSAQISVICGQKKSLADTAENKKIFSQKEEKKISANQRYWRAKKVSRRYRRLSQK
ncbi:MAG: hypothetical protein QM541_13145 [Flavobacterium sp.]|nr:hypothetical protein [Flavobacterium sp.]